jgi:hypothetical protein
MVENFGGLTPYFSRNRSARRGSRALGIVIGIAAVIVYQTVTRPNPDSTAGMPPAELAFVSAATEAQMSWVTAPNDLARVDMPAQRAASLCQALPGLAATAWRGRIANITPDGFPDFNGKKTAHIVIALSSHLDVTTPAAPLLNNPNTMVEAGSAIYTVAATLPIGAPVVFSGTFFPDAANCLTVTNLTLDGSMTDPNFKISLTGLAAK